MYFVKSACITIFSTESQLEMIYYVPPLLVQKQSPKMIAVSNHSLSGAKIVIKRSNFIAKIWGVVRKGYVQYLIAKESWTLPSKYLNVIIVIANFALSASSRSIREGTVSKPMAITSNSGGDVPVANNSSRKEAIAIECRVPVSINFVQCVREFGVIHTNNVSSKLTLSSIKFTIGTNTAILGNQLCNAADAIISLRA